MPKMANEAQLHSFTNQLAERLDKVLALQLPDYSRSRFQNLIKGGHVYVDQELVTKSGFNLAGGEKIQIDIPAPENTDLKPEKIPIDVLFEDSNVIVVNKSAGMVVHPSLGHPSGTLINAVLAHAPDIQGIGGEIRPGLVHRLDRDTSGTIILAKNEKTLNLLQRQFADRQVEKNYLALVEGHPPSNSGRIEAPIGRDPRKRKQMAVVPLGNGREAISEYRVRENFLKHALLDVTILTGRTHQIRVHLAFLGVPIVADPLYGHRKPSLQLDRHFLHAASLIIRIPGERIERRFDAPLPPELETELAKLRS
jgi:23S rRNA pseudouridine1911/1915/1917 synthase